MAFFKKRETITQNIAYMGIMAAINVAFVLVATLLPFLLFILVFVLPLTSVIVTVFCKKRYYLIYAVSTLILCCLVTSYSSISDTLFYVLPSLITGFIFGTLIEKQIPSILIIAITTFIQGMFSYASIRLIELIYGRNIIIDFATIFNLQNYPYLYYIVPIFIFVLALVQQSISYIVIINELPKFGINENDNKNIEIYAICCTFLMSILSLIFAFVAPTISYPLMLGSMLFGIFQAVYLLSQKKKWLFISIGSLFIFSIIFTLAIYSYIPKPLGFLTFQIFFISITIINLINKYLLKN